MLRPKLIIDFYIATQELADHIPDRIISLSLIVTTAGGLFWQNLPSVSLASVTYGIHAEFSSGKALCR